MCRKIYTVEDYKRFVHYLCHLILPLIYGSIIPITDHPFS